MIQPAPTLQKDTFSLSQCVDARRLEINARLDPKNKSAQGQFMTPQDVANFMASLFGQQDIGEIRLLDAGAGVGSLTAAFVEEFSNRQHHIPRIAVTAYEPDPVMAEGLRATFAECKERCQQVGITFAPELLQRDFIEAAAQQLPMQLSITSEPVRRFTHAVLNPPYKKIHSASDHRKHLRAIGVETSNLYTGFLAIAIKLLEDGGELVAITPRSFCNGPYFKPFRELLLKEMALRHIHIFESRTQAFKDDEVLQENVIFHAVKRQPQEDVTLSVSQSADFAHMQRRSVSFAQIVRANDPERFIHIVAHEEDQRLVEHMHALPCGLKDLGIDASTGPVVDFRLKEYLRKQPEPDTVPLIYPVHCQDHQVCWPVSESRKNNAIMDVEPVQKWLYPNGHYTLVRRFSSKEERRRVVAAVHDPVMVSGEKIGFENHLNVFHHNRQGLTPDLAKGLAVYLNSTFFDVCFRQFNGHTQVNVRDLYTLRYPDQATLEAFGQRVNGHGFPTQEEIDTWIEEELF